jgi:hypothetical protein
MKLTKIMLLCGATAIATTGCFSRKEIIRESSGAAVIPAAPAAVVPAAPSTVVVQAPPAPQTEVMGVAPSPNHVWIPGHWNRDDDRWVWMSGHWERRPSSKSVYVPGHWEKKGDGYIWREGEWK